MYHKTIQVKPFDTYVTVGVKNNYKNSRFKVGDHVRISIFNNIFAKYYKPKKLFLLKKLKMLYY